MDDRTTLAGSHTVKNAVCYLFLVFFLSACTTQMPQTELRGTGDLGVIIERAAGSVLIVENSNNQVLARVEGLGDLSHASVVFSRDARFAYVFGRDGGLTKVDLLKQRIDKRIIQAGNSIGGAISQDGRLIAVGNYEPGGVRVFTADTLELVADIPATELHNGKNARVVGMADAPEQKFMVSLFDTGEIWILDFSDSSADAPTVTRFTGIGKQPYDAMLTPEGRYYVAGLFGEDGLAMLDLWNPDKGVTRVLAGYGRGNQPLPVYKMPHLEGWTVAENLAFVPAVGQHQVLVLNMLNWTEQGRIDVLGQPVFVMARPDARQIWVNFAYPDNQYVQIIDSQTQAIIKTIEPGPGVLHMEFTPRGEQIWISVRDRNEVQIWDTRTLEHLYTLEANSPSGIFFSNRAHRIGL